MISDIKLCFLIQTNPRQTKRNTKSKETVLSAERISDTNCEFHGGKSSVSRRNETWISNFYLSSPHARADLFVCLITRIPLVRISIAILFRLSKVDKMAWFLLKKCNVSYTHAILRSSGRWMLWYHFYSSKSTRKWSKFVLDVKLTYCSGFAEASSARYIRYISIEKCYWLLRWSYKVKWRFQGWN